MVIVAKTKDGFLVSATEEEVTEILRSVSGKTPEKIEIGHRIPAIDYAGSITKVKALRDSYDFKELVDKCDEFYLKVSQLKDAVSNAARIDA